MLLAHGHADVDSPNEDGDTALHLAAHNGNVDIIEVLLAWGAAINRTGQGGQTALMLAALNGHECAIETLLAAGADANLTDMFEEQALLRVAAWNVPLLLKILVEEGCCDVNATNSDGHTALMAATTCGQVSMVQHLLALAMDVEMKNSTGETAVYFAEIGNASERKRQILALFHALGQ